MPTVFKKCVPISAWCRVVLLCLVLHPAAAQRPVEVIPMIMAPYPIEFHEFEEDYTSYTITIVNYTFEQQSLYFHVGLNGNNGVSAQTNESYKPSTPFILEPRETYVMSAEEFRELNDGFTTNDFTYDGITELQLAIGVLPEGSYEFCVVAFDFMTDQQLTVGCSFSFPVGNGDVPRIIYPFEGDVIDGEIESFPITWEAPTSNPMQSMDFEYVVKLVDLSLYGDSDYEDVFLDGGVAVTLEQTVQGMTTMFYNDEGDDPPLIVGHQYGLRVQVIDPSQTLTFENNGYSEIRTFFFAEMGVPVVDSTETQNQLADLPIDCESRCQIVPIADQIPLASIEGFESLRMGHFYIQNYTLSPAGDTWQGEGEIVLNFLNELRIRVALNGIQFNSAGEIIAGTVRGIQDEGDVAEFMEYVTFPVLDGQMDMAAGMIPDDISSQIGHYLRDTRMIAALAGMGQIGLPVGFSENISGVEFTVGITDLLLTPSGAKAKIVAGTRLPMFEGDNWLMFVADSVCIHPAGFGGEYLISLGADLVLQNESENAFGLKLNGPVASGPSCALEMNCEGLQAVIINGSIDFARSVIVPEMEDGTIGEGKVKAAFSFTWTRSAQGDTAVAESSGAQWLASLNIDRFQIPRLNGWTFEVTEGWLDMSELDNPDGIVFPVEYETTGLDFTGVYIASATIRPPQSMCKGPRPDAEIQHMIIDPNLYGQLTVDSLLRMGQGNIGGWSWSVDLFTLEIYNNQLIEARLEGELHMPLLDTSSHIDYYALIGQGEAPEGEAPGDEPYSYEFNMSFSDEVRYSFLIAEGEIYDDSVLDVNYTPADTTQISVHAILHGILTIDTDQFLPDDFPDLPASIQMPQLEYSLDYHSDTGFNPDGTYVSFASPSKFVSGFPINMENFDIGLSTTAENEISFDFNIAISFAQDEADLSASVQFSLISNLTTLNVFEGVTGVGDATESLLTFHSLLLDRIVFDSIILDVQVSELILQGAIGFYNNPLPDGGRDKGVRGDISVVLPIGPNGITGQLTAIFGNIGTPALSYSESFFPYWYVNGLISFPVAIQFGTLPLGLYGIGGGVGYNMIQTAAPQIVDGVIEGTSVFEPVYQSFRLELKVIMGTTPKPDAFNADLTFIAQFVNGGLDMIGIEGDGYVMTPMADRLDPQVYVGCDIYMYMPNETRPWSIEGGVDIAINIADGVLVGNMSPSEIPNQVVDGSFHASPDLFYFYMGQPDFNIMDDEDPRGSAMLDLDFIQAQAKTYLMIGNGVPTSLPPLPMSIQNILAAPEGELEGTSSATTAQQGFDPDQIETASGLAHGTYVEIMADIDAYLLYASLSVYLGYDMNITERSTTCVNTGDIIGVNGWYAEGQAYAGIVGAMGIRIKVLGERRSIKLFDLAAAIALFGGAPNPFYFGGQAAVQYSVLNGLVEGNSSFAFSVGERCSPALDDPMAGIDFFEYIDPAQDERGVFVGAPMHVKLAMPVLEDIVIPQAVEDANGNVIREELLRYRPELTWHLNRQGQSQHIAMQPAIWTDEDQRQQLYLMTQQSLEAQTWHELHLTIKAWDYQEGRYLRVDGETWMQDTIIRFRTGTLPRDLYNYVTHTVPLPMERYYLQGESGNGRIYFSQAIDQSHYFPVSDAYANGYQYYVRLTHLANAENIEVPFTYHSNVASGYHYLRFTMPDLESEAIYALQVIRKSPALPAGLRPGGTTQRSLASFTSGTGTSTALTITSQSTVPPGEALEQGEFLLFHSYFGTSAFQTLREKIDAADMQEVTYAPNPHALYGKKARLSLTLAEPFEQRDFHSFQPSAIYPFMTFLPRIRILDLFTTNYHDQHAERRILNFKNYYQDEVQGYPFTVSWPVNTDFEWEHPQTYRLGAAKIDAILQSPLQENEIVDPGQSFGQSSGAWQGARGGAQVGGLSSNLNCHITYDSHYKVNKDRKVVLDWCASYLAALAPVFPANTFQHLMQQYHPGFLNRYQNLLDDDLRLENYEGTYNLQFGHNIATRPDEEVIQILTMYNMTFLTPGGNMLQPVTINPIVQWNNPRQ
jgi:hypothetical protein